MGTCPKSNFNYHTRFNLYLISLSPPLLSLCVFLQVNCWKFVHAWTCCGRPGVHCQRLSKLLQFLSCCCPSCFLCYIPIALQFIYVFCILDLGCLYLFSLSPCLFFVKSSIQINSIELNPKKQRKKKNMHNRKKLVSQEVRNDSHKVKLASWLSLAVSTNGTERTDNQYLHGKYWILTLDWILKAEDVPVLL